MRRKMAFLAGLALALVPAYGDAHSRSAGLVACAEALAEGLGHGVAPVKYRFDERSDFSGRRLARRETIHLDAFDPAGGEVVARYDCSINGRAEVLELLQRPLGAGSAADRAVGLR